MLEPATVLSCVSSFVHSGHSGNRWCDARADDEEGRAAPPMFVQWSLMAEGIWEEFVKLDGRMNPNKE